MNPIKALVWKEWRECRTFVAIAAMLMLSVRIAWPLLPFIFPEIRTDDWNLYKCVIGGIIFPLISFFVIIFSSFQYELKNNTLSCLLIKPISTARIFWVKYFWGLSIFLSLILLSLWIFNVYSVDFCKSSTKMPTSFLVLICMYTFLFSSSMLYRIKHTARNNMLAFLCIVLGFISILHIIASVFFIMFAYRESFNVILIIFTGISLFTGYTIWQKKVSKDASPLGLVTVISIAFFICSVLIFLSLNLYASWKLNAVIREAETAGIKVNVENLNKLKEGENESDELYQKAFALGNLIHDKYKSCCCRKHFIEKNGKPPEELLFNDPDYKKLLNTVDEILVLPSRRFNILSFDKYGFPKEIRELSNVANLLELYVDSLLADKKYDEAIYFCQKISKLLDGAPDKPFGSICSNLSSYENRLVWNILKVPSDSQYLETFRFFLSRLDKTSRELPEKIVQDSASDYYGRINKYLTGQHEIGSFLGENNKIIEYLLAEYFGRPYLKKTLYVNMASSIHHIDLFRIDDTEEILQAIVEDDRKFNLHYSFSYIPCGSIASSKIYVDLNRQALALKIFKAEHGSYPEKLEEIVPGILPGLPVDYFSGKNFVYRKNGDGFILYSFGRNMRDDGGDRNYSKDKKDDITCVCEN